ncbi:MAG: hypothetical protein H6834_05675 [Planctomycetes bacterium]|nr:hypothetical protein [Planctomycetota bacterium]MCB9890882.1 hypothetical protein [Planctomycetota bacterium]
MKFFLLDTAGDLDDDDLCLLDDVPEGMELYDFCLSRGIEATPYYPKDAKVRLRDENPGIKVCDVIGSLKNCFVGSSKVRTILQEHGGELPVEYLDFTLLNHKGRVHSTDHAFINPVGGLRCLQPVHSGVKRDDDGDVIDIDAFVLDGALAEELPPFFRMEEDPTRIVLREDLCSRLQEAQVTNLVVRPLEIRA